MSTPFNLHSPTLAWVLLDHRIESQNPSHIEGQRLAGSHFSVDRQCDGVLHDVGAVEFVVDQHVAFFVFHADASSFELRV